MPEPARFLATVGMKSAFAEGLYPEAIAKGFAQV
jgi:hypothetical protein